MVAAPSFPSSLILQPLKPPPSNPLLPQRNPRLLTPFSSPLRSSAAEPKPPPRRKAMEGGARAETLGGGRDRTEPPGGRLSRRASPRSRSCSPPLRRRIPSSPSSAAASRALCARPRSRSGGSDPSSSIRLGMHGLGGRMATRMIDPQQLVFDHAAQFFTVSDQRFQKLVDRWLDEGLVREWKGLLGELEGGGHFTPLTFSSPRYIGAKGMRLLADSIIRQSRMVDIVRPCWISQLEPFNGKWYLSEKAKPHGQFDAIVIAHNGKCANRLLSSSGLPLLTKQMKRLELSAVWALLAAFKDPLPLPQNGACPTFEGAFVKGVDSISWMANNTSKLFPFQSGMPQCWTFFSTSAYGQRNKVPQELLSIQENIPSVTAEKVKEEMLGGVEYALGLPKGLLQRPFYTRVQLWGAALPTNTPGVPCIFDPHGRAGICGDWLLGSSVEAAALSGMSLANHMANYFQSGDAQPDEFAVVCMRSSARLAVMILVSFRVWILKDRYWKLRQLQLHEKKQAGVWMKVQSGFVGFLQKYMSDRVV
uniref:Renalase n=1 Tax=Ananas comosus var. bracteatus TaxID=296719 RepID=A0A6V7QFW7_ANACO|nr:unnamed protein product [Ananas comosus var. bracteatus]